MRRTLSIVAMLACLLGVAPTAFAGGYEIQQGGAKALGRGGAWYARSDDPIALLYNPANLAKLRRFQNDLDINWPLQRACFDRVGTYTDSAYYTNKAADSSFGDPNQPPPNGFQGVQEPEVCNSAWALPVPQSGFAIPFGQKFTLGIGNFTPNAVSTTQYGNNDGTVDIPGTSMRLPSPARFMLLKRRIVLFYPTIGFGYAPTPRFRFGAAFGWGLGWFRFTQYATATTLVNEDLASEIANRIQVRDMFVPRVTVSVAGEPIPHLTVSGTLMWTGDVKAKGNLQIVSGAFRAQGPYGQGANNASSVKFNNVSFTAPQPLRVALGIRYGIPLPGYENPGTEPQPDSNIQDPMDTELADIEVDFTYTRSSQVKNFLVDIPQCTPTTSDPTPCPINNVITANAPSTTSGEVVLPHHWRDQYGVNIGGDVNIIPGSFAVRTGFSYESSAVDRPFTNVDFWPMQRFGLHVGFTQRLGQLDFTFGYGYFFQTPVSGPNRMQTGGLRTTTGQDSSPGAPTLANPNSVITNDLKTQPNIGTFRSRIQEIAIGMNTRF